jgi:hypothetical protein
MGGSQQEVRPPASRTLASEHSSVACPVEESHTTSGHDFDDMYISRLTQQHIDLEHRPCREPEIEEACPSFDDL